MLVEFKNNWFSPSKGFMRDKLTKLSGYCYRKGIRDVPEALLGLLPSSAVVVDLEYKEQKDAEKAAEAETSDTLKAYDTARGASDAEAEVHNEVHDKMAGARKAKAEKARKAKLETN